MSVVYDPLVFSVAKDLKETAQLICEQGDTNPEITRKFSQLIEDAILSAYRLGWHEGQR